MKSLKRMLYETMSSEMNPQIADNIYTRLTCASPKSDYARELAVYIAEYYNNQLDKYKNEFTAERIGETAALKTKIKTLERKFDVSIPAPSCEQNKT